jgi:hypothetical protein
MRISLVLMALLPIALFASSKTDAREPKTAAPDVYEIKTVNVAGEKLTATFQGDIVTLEARPDTDVIVNGAEASFKDLEPGMNAKVTLAEPGVAARIEANGEVAANSTTAFGSATTATKTESPLTKGNRFRSYRGCPVFHGWNGCLYFLSYTQNIFVDMGGTWPFQG